MSGNDLQQKEDADVLAETEKDFSPAEQTEYDKLSQNDPEGTDSDEKLGKGFRKEPARPGLRTAASNLSTYRKLGIGMGLMGILVAIAVAFFSFMLPFKLTHIIESIEQRVGNVPEYAVDRRLEFYMNRYLMIRTLEATGDFDFSPGGADRDRFTYLGDSFWNTMYTNWKGAKLENTLATKYGIKIRADVNPEVFRRSSKIRADQFSIEHTGVGKESRLRNQSLDRTEVRDFIKQFAKEETRSHEVFKRYNMRKVMKRYYGVGNWKPFERKIDEGKNAYYEKKRAIQKRLVTETVGRLSERYEKYMNCLLGSTTASACRAELKKADPDINLADADKKSSGIDDTNNKIDDLTPEGGSDKTLRKKIAGEISDKLAEFGIKKTTQKLVASAAAGLGIIDSLNTVYNTLNSGILNQVIYDKNAQQYLAYTAPILSAADQIRSGEDFSLEDLRATQEIFDGYDESPVYQAGIPGRGTVSAAGSIYRDCNGDEADGKETLLDPGETVCPNKRLVQDKTSFTNSQGWQTLGTILAPYNGTLSKIVAGINNLIGSVLDATGITNVIKSIMSAFNLDELAAKSFGFLLNRIAGPVISGAEVSGDAYENLYAGIATQRAAVGGEVGVAKEDTIGGGYLSDKQYSVIRDEQMGDYYKELKGKSFFARYFSPSVKESLTGQVAMHMPANASAASQQVVSTLANPFKIFSSLGSVFSPRAGAATIPQSNPFHVINMGFAADSPVFTANDGEGMDYGEINARYHCDTPVADRDQNKQFGRPDDLPFDVPIASDPCLLEEAVRDASTRYFDGSFDEGVSSGTSSASTVTASATVVGDPSTESASVQCAAGTKDLGIKPGYNDGTPISVRLCAIPTIVSNSLESQLGNLFSIPGADGKLIVNSRISGAVLAMSQAAIGSSVTFKADSGWRSNEHQDALWNQLGQDTALVARPGFSNHQAGAAIDFDLNDADAVKGATCDNNRATAPADPQWKWLLENAARFGFGQYAVEPWHWDATTSDRICR